MAESAAPVVEHSADDFGRLLLRLRRDRGLSRVTLGAAAGCSRQYIEMLETRDREHPSPQLVSALAGALQVEGAEREQLFEAAGMSVPVSLPRGFNVLQLLTGLVRGLDAPAAVIDPEWWLLGWNRAFTETFEVSVGALPAGGSHLLQIWFEPQARRQVLNWDDFMPGLVAAFKAATRDHAHTLGHERTLTTLRATQRFAELYRGARRIAGGQAPPPLCYRHSTRGPLWFQPALLSTGRGQTVGALLFLRAGDAVAEAAPPL